MYQDNSIGAMCKDGSAKALYKDNSVKAVYQDGSVGAVCQEGSFTAVYQESSIGPVDNEGSVVAVYTHIFVCISRSYNREYLESLEKDGKVMTAKYKKCAGALGMIGQIMFC